MAERALIYRDAFDNIFKLPAAEYERIANSLENERFLYETSDVNGCPIMLNLEHFVCMFIAEVSVSAEEWKNATD